MDQATRSPRRRLKGGRKAGITLSLHRFTTLAGQLVDELPPRLVRQLNGGFMVLPEANPDGDLYIMGEYVEDAVLGRFVVLYYGSFAALLGNAPEEAWAAELKETIRHELRHHLEALAGVDDLTREELAALGGRS